MKDNSSVDRIDRYILAALQQDGSLSNVELGRQVNLSPPAIHARIKRLEQLGYIRAYRAVLDRELLDFDMLCFIQVTLQNHQPDDVERFRQSVVSMPEVLECHHVTGNVDYLIKVVVRSRHELQQFLMERLTPIRGIARMQTSLVLTELKSTTTLPIIIEDTEEE